MGRRLATWIGLWSIVLAVPARAQEDPSDEVAAEAPADAEAREAAPETEPETPPTETPAEDPPTEEPSEPDEGAPPTAAADLGLGSVPDPGSALDPPPIPAGYGDDGVWADYHRAALALADDEEERAAEILREVASHEGHPAAARAQELLDRLGESRGALLRSGERASALARGELVAWHILGGAGLGSTICALAWCDSARTWTLVPLAFAGVGGGLALALSRNGVSPGQGNLYGAAMRWGYLDAWLLASVMGLTWRERDDGGFSSLESTDWHIGALIAGQVIALGAAVGVDLGLAPTAGDVALMDTLHLLTASTTTFIVAAADGFNFFDTLGDVRRALTPLLVANAAALGFGAYLTTKVTMTRARAILIDLGMLLGAGLGVGLPFLIAGDSAEATGILTGGAIGTVAGFVGGWFATRGMSPTESEDDSRGVAFGVGPTAGGAQAQLSIPLR